MKSHGSFSANIYLQIVPGAAMCMPSITTPKSKTCALCPVQVPTSGPSAKNLLPTILT